jgi:hypothetical protein
MVWQVAYQASIGRVTKGLGKLSIPKSTADAIIAQSSLGYAQAYQTTLKEARDAGLTDKEAEQIAGDAAQRTAIWYGITAPISPQTKAVESLFGPAEKELIKKAVNALNTVITTLRNALRILNAALAAYQIYTKIRLFLLNAKLVKLSIELAAPSPGGVKPTAGITLTQIVKDIQNIKIAQEKAKEYQLGVNAASQFLNIFVRSINKIKVKLDQLKFIIVDPTTNPSSGINANNDLTNQIDGASTTAPSEDTYINVLGKSYILKLVTLPNNYRQYQALDSFSKMKITQTAPSKIKTNDELFEEIKQILG